MGNKYPKNSPIPNWPKELKKEYFSTYCTPVVDAIIQGLGNTPLRKKFLSSDRQKITPEELEVIQEAYNKQVDLILMMEELKS